MSWLYGQTWLWYLIAFLVGVLLAWLFLVLPQQRRLRALQSRGTAPAPAASPAADEDTAVLGSVPAAAAVGLGGAGLAAAAVAEHASDSGGDVEREPVTEQIPAVDPALSTLDTGTITGGADDRTGPLVTLGKDTTPADDSPTETIPAGTHDEPTTEFPPTPPADDATPPAGTDVAAGSTDATVDGADTATTTEPGATDEAAPPADAATAEGTAEGEAPTSPGGVGIVAGAAGLTAAAVAGEGDTDTSSDDEATGDAGAEAATGTDPVAPDAATSDADGSDGKAAAGDRAVTAGDTALAGAAGVHALADTPDAPAGDATPVEPPTVETAAAGVATGAGALGVAGLAAAHSSGSGSDSDSAAPYGPGSAHPAADGSAPGEEYTIKGNADSMLYHAPESPYYVRTRAEAWFVTAEAAEAAGFQPWHRNRKRAAVQGLVAAPTFEAGPYPGSAKPNDDGSAPTPAFMIKGNEDSMLYHLPTSPYYARTKAEVWFTHESDAQAAGFTAWKRK